MKLILASHNKNKIKEFREILKDSEIELISLTDLDDFEDIVEDGLTFSENALIKAKNISFKYNLPTISDDSGIEILTLNNRPGIYSARYSGNGDYYNNLKVLEELKDETNRSARFICVIVLYNIDGSYQTFEGVWEGNISYSIKGTNGFGYDPIFIPNGYNNTVAELGDSVKSRESHRAKALQLFKEKYRI